jgi:hypothetical protein
MSRTITKVTKKEQDEQGNWITTSTTEYHDEDKEHTQMVSGAVSLFVVVMFAGIVIVGIVMTGGF